MQQFSDGLNITSINGIPNSRLEHALRNCAGRAARRAARGGFVYLFRCEGFTKIGVCRDNVAKRLSTAQVGCPFEIVLLKSWRVADPSGVERLLHHQFAQYHKRGEWYALPPDKLAKLLDCQDVSAVVDIHQN